MPVKIPTIKEVVKAIKEDNDYTPYVNRLNRRNYLGVGVVVLVEEAKEFIREMERYDRDNKRDNKCSLCKKDDIHVRNLHGIDGVNFCEFCENYATSTNLLICETQNKLEKIDSKLCKLLEICSFFYPINNDEA